MGSQVLSLNTFMGRCQALGGTSWKDVLRMDPCTYCWAFMSKVSPSKKMTMDHIQPKTKGGANGWSNITPACLHCNRLKENMLLLNFLISQQRLLRLRRRQVEDSKHARFTKWLNRASTSTAVNAVVDASPVSTPSSRSMTRSSGSATMEHCGSPA